MLTLAGSPCSTLPSSGSASSLKKKKKSDINIQLALSDPDTMLGSIRVDKTIPSPLQFTYGDRENRKLQYKNLGEDKNKTSREYCRQFPINHFKSKSLSQRKDM